MWLWMVIVWLIEEGGLVFLLVIDMWRGFIIVFSGKMVVVFFLVLFILFMLVQGTAFATLGERYFLGGSQQRLGPNKVRFWGLLQPIADGIKLVKKEQFYPLRSSGFFFVFVPGIVFVIMCLE